MRIAAAIFGIVFGAVLAWARLTDPEVIQRMLMLREVDVFLLMGSAMTVAFVGVRLLRLNKATSLIGREPITWSSTRPTRDHVRGSVVFGLGWSIACTCPGPLAAQLGLGNLTAIATIAGLFFGVALAGARRTRGTGSPVTVATIGL